MKIMIVILLLNSNSPITEEDRTISVDDIIDDSSKNSFTITSFLQLQQSIKSIQSKEVSSSHSIES